jgi:hypothetical protein
MAELGTFSVEDLESFSRAIRELGRGSADMQEAAQRVTDYLHDHLRSADGAPELLVSLCHKTHVFGGLPPHLQDLARTVDPSIDERSVCLVRLSQSGYADGSPEARSLVQPLTAAAFDSQPILVAMLVAMGLDIDSALDPDRALSMPLHHRSLPEFLLPDDVDSVWFEDLGTGAQLERLGARSLLGLGGALPSGDLFFVFLFSRTPIPTRTAELMRTIATATKATLIPFSLRPFGSA